MLAGICNLYKMIDNAHDKVIKSLSEWRYIMPEIVSRQVTNYRNEDSVGGYESIEVRARIVGKERNLIAINMAVQALMGDFANFEPPIIGVDESMIDIEARQGEATASFIHGGSIPLTGVPEGYTVDGYPWNADQTTESSD